MKNTPFTSKHIALGAKMAEFAGYNMPISYSGINDEHATVLLFFPVGEKPSYHGES